MQRMFSYTQWSIRKQLQVIFISAYIIVIAVYVLMTLLELSFLQAYLESNSYTVLKNNVTDQMKLLINSHVSYSTAKLAVLLSYLYQRKFMIEITLGFSDISHNYFDPGYPVNARFVPLDTFNISYGYYSRFEQLSVEGQSIVSKLAGLDPILPDIFGDELYGIYEGFYTDEIYNFCPIYYMADTGYSPLSREWFYEAAKSAPKYIVTEPYYDYTSDALLITGSIAIMNGSEVFGVTAIDVTVSTVSDLTAELRVLDNGIVMMVSHEGIILNPPSEWGGVMAERIYDEALTGISFSQWQEMQGYEIGTVFEINVVGFGLSLMVIDQIIDQGSGTVFYYVIAVVKIDDVKQPTYHLNSSFGTIYQILFWCIICISIIFLLLSLVFIYISSRKLSLKLGQITKIFDSIIIRACFPSITKNCSFADVEKNNSGIEKFVESCKVRVNLIAEKEESFKYFPWERTRPANSQIYTKWKERIYPFNRFTGKEDQWDLAIEEIKKKVG